MVRFVVLALPLLLLSFAAFGVAVEAFDLEPRTGTLIHLGLVDGPSLPTTIVLATWVMESCGLIALFLCLQGRLGSLWLDGVATGWLAWIFRGPITVVTIVVATRQPQDDWWRVALAWLVLYSLCGLALAILARASGLGIRRKIDLPAAQTPVSPVAEPSPTVRVD